jgi:hypothetical protein
MSAKKKAKVAAAKPRANQVATIRARASAWKGGEAEIG